MNFAWGKKKTQLFFSLTPEKVLSAVESLGIRTTGRCLPLNSMENRVYEVELEQENESKNPSERFRVVKFYRPGRWSKNQILEEHEFLLDLVKEEIPVIPPLHFPDGSTLKEENGIYYALFPKQGGRAPDELGVKELEWIARVLARVHIVGAEKEMQDRICLNIDTYGRANLDFLLQEQLIPIEMEKRYANAVEKICDYSEPLFQNISFQRIHGDCHLGNILWHPDHGPRLLDFDDSLMGPCVQDFWLLISGRESENKYLWDVFLSSYETLKEFNREELRLVEPLRALRYVHFHAWIGKRWQDPAFQQTFPYYGSHAYWQKELEDLEYQLELLL